MFPGGLLPFTIHKNLISRCSFIPDKTLASLIKQRITYLDVRLLVIHLPERGQVFWVSCLNKGCPEFLNHAVDRVLTASRHQSFHNLQGRYATLDQNRT